MLYDPIADLERLGYTPREAAFLYLVGRNSGYFLRRQFVQFANGSLGALPQHFVSKALNKDHISALDYGQRRHVYHLNSRTIYRILQMEDCPNRRAKGDHQIATRLLIVDYVLERLKEQWLSTEQEKVDFFTTETGLNRDCLPHSLARTSNGSTETVARYFSDRFPIAVSQADEESAWCVRFTYFDEGACTVKAFNKFLSTYQQLLENLDAFELDYVSFSSRNFVAAEKSFRTRFLSAGSTVTSKLLPFGCDHLIRFFAAEDRWDRNDSRFSQADLAILREGEKSYVSPEHELLRSAWHCGRSEFESELRSLGEVRQPKTVFKPCIVQQSYPLFGYKNAGNW
jgi:hypothetical protein